MIASFSRSSLVWSSLGANFSMTDATMGSANEAKMADLLANSSVSNAIFCESRLLPIPKTFCTWRLWGIGSILVDLQPVGRGSCGNTCFMDMCLINDSAFMDSDNVVFSRLFVLESLRNPSRRCHRVHKRWLVHPGDSCLLSLPPQGLRGMPRLNAWTEQDSLCRSPWTMSPPDETIHTVLLRLS